MNPLFSNTSAGFKLFIFLGLLLFGAILGMLAGLIGIVLFLHVPMDQLTLNSGGETGLNVARLLQISGQIGLFILPPLAYAWLVSSKPFRNLGFSGVKHWGVLLAGVAIMYFGLPLIHFFGELNLQLKLPDSLSGIENWMLLKEEEAALLGECFLSVDTISGLMINLFMVALLPALGEEMVFRGVLQPLFIRLVKNVHLGIFIAALLFGMMHLQFYGLIPRVLLGMFLGYFYFYTSSLWVPILMHFLNNGTAVVVYYLHHNGFIEVEMENFGAVQNQLYTVLSVLMVTGLILYARTVYLKQKATTDLL